MIPVSTGFNATHPPFPKLGIPPSYPLFSTPIENALPPSPGDRPWLWAMSFPLLESAQAFPGIFAGLFLYILLRAGFPAWAWKVCQQSAIPERHCQISRQPVCCALHRMICVVPSGPSALPGSEQRNGWLSGLGLQAAHDLGQGPWILPHCLLVSTLQASQSK